MHHMYKRKNLPITPFLLPKHVSNGLIMIKVKRQKNLEKNIKITARNAPRGRTARVLYIQRY